MLRIKQQNKKSKRFEGFENCQNVFDHKNRHILHNMLLISAFYTNNQNRYSVSDSIDSK